MKEKLQIKKGDRDRVLMTEVLPYETPIIFSNRLLYDFAKLLRKDPSVIPARIRDILSPGKMGYTIPYEYAIRQGADKTRTLAIMHPAHQLTVPDFYDNYESLILSLCRRSSFSLRHPIRVASFFYTRESDAAESLATNEVDVEPTSEEVAGKYAGSYFYYSKFNQLYKFVDSKEFLELERNYNRLLKFDIKRCFASIYTHSLSWAVKGKEFAKQHRGVSFDGDFDVFMQRVNYNETNGIIVGPELSRIFCEVILQRIDLDISLEAASKGISSDDYHIQRYLDDYFLFSRSKPIEDEIFAVVQEKLQTYKMYINEGKTEFYSAPFTTAQTIVKSDVQALLGSTLLSWLKDLRKIVGECSKLKQYSDLLKDYKPPRIPSTLLIRDLKISIARGNQGFNVISSYSLSAILKSCYRLQRQLAKNCCPKELQLHLQNLLICTLEVVFYIYAMDFRVRTTYLISQILIVIGKLSATDERLALQLRTRIAILSQQLLSSRADNELGGVEISNLLVALRSVLPEHRLSMSDLRRYFAFNEKRKSGRLSYFDMMSIIYYIKDDIQYKPLSVDIELQISKRFNDSSVDLRIDSESTLLWFDVLACPYLSAEFKRNMASAFLKKSLGTIPSVHSINEIIGFCKNKIHFINWSDDLDLERLLMRKQLSPGY